MKSFIFFGLKRKLEIFSSVEDFFKLNSNATEGEKDKTGLKTTIFSKLRKFKRIQYIEI